MKKAPHKIVLLARELNPVAVSDTIAALPDLAGFGNVHSLHQAMARSSYVCINFCRAANDKECRKQA